MIFLNLLMGRAFICFIFSLIIRLSIVIQIFYVKLACSAGEQYMKRFDNCAKMEEPKYSSLDSLFFEVIVGLGP